MLYYKSENDYLPNTTEECEINFNEDIFNNFEGDSINMKNQVQEEETAPRNKKGKSTTRMQIHMQDYPIFYGTESEWPGVKEKLRCCQNPKDWMNWSILRTRMHMDGRSM